MTTALLRCGIRRLFAISLIAQVWYEIHVFGREPLTFPYAYRLVLVLGFALSMLSSGRFKLVNSFVRLWIAVDFAYSIADRFGVLGPYGSPGVSFGSWKNFVAYTHVLNGLLPLSAAPFLAAAATAYEAILSLTLSLGIYSRFFSAATALLTAVYVVTMTLTSGFSSQFEFAVLLICTGSSFLATCQTHGVTKGEKSVAGLDRLRVSVQNAVAAGEGADEHQ
jgi:putative oxidoreductase